MKLIRDLKGLEAAEKRWDEMKRNPTSKVVETMRSHFKPGVFLQLVESDCPHVVAVVRGLLAHGTSNARPERVFSLAKDVIDQPSCPGSAKELELVVTLAFMVTPRMGGGAGKESSRLY